MALQTLGSRQVTATLDQTGLNTGNWTVQLTDQILNSNVDPYEIYHFFVSTVTQLQWSATPAVGQFQVWVNNVPWDNQPYSANNSWDPSQPLLLHPGDEVDFFFSFGTGNPPIVTAWLRYNDGS
jgi:hypothetical protein